MQSVAGAGVVVTGAGSGIGAALARKFAAEGARVVVNDLNAAAAGEVARSCGATAAPGEAASADGVASRLPWRDGRAVYVFGRAWVSDPDGALEGDLQRRFASCGSYETRGIRNYCLEQATSARAGARGSG